MKNQTRLRITRVVFLSLVAMWFIVVGASVSGHLAYGGLILFVASVIAFVVLWMLKVKDSGDE